MRRILLAIVLAFAAIPASAQSWDRVNGSMQVKSGPAAPLVIIDQTNTATNRKILSLRAAGTEKCSIDIDGDLVCAGSYSFTAGQILAPVTPTDCSAPQYSFTGDTDTGVGYGAVNTLSLCAGGGTSAYIRPNTLDLLNDGHLLLFGAAQDLVATREAAGHWFQRNSTSAQRASWANTYTSATNYEAFSVDWQTTANTAIVGTRTAATGTGRTLRLYAQASSAGAGGGVIELSPSGGILISATAPTIASGGCTSPAVTWNNGTAAFLITIGTSCAGVKTVTLTMPAAANAWACDGDNHTSDAAQQTNYIVARSTSTTAVVLTSYDRVTGLQEDFTASNTYLMKCSGG